MAETPIQRRIMLALSKAGARIFRHNVGQAWQGKAKQLGDGRVLIENAHPVRYGLAVGGSDVIGWHSVEITPAMVGRRVALFVAVEVKDRAPVTQEQRDFIAAVRAAGGIAGVARSEGEALELISSPCRL